MKKIYLLLLFCCLGMAARAQLTAASYVYSYNGSGTYTALGTSTTLYTSGWDEGTTTGIPLGFTFKYLGTSYTTVAMNCNGYISFDGAASGFALATPLSSNTLTIAALGEDLAGVNASSTIKYNTTGTAPNRIFTIQWAQANSFSATASGPFNFQIKLYESTNTIQVIEGTWNTTAGGALTGQMGITGSATTDYSIRTETTSWASPAAASSNTATMTHKPADKPVSGYTYTWVPPATLSLNTSSTAFTTAAGTTSTTTNITLAGYGLSATAVTVTAPANFQVYNGSAWVTTYTLATTAGTDGSYYVSATVPLRFNAPVTTGTYTGNLAFSGTGYTTTNCALTGNSVNVCSGTPTAGTAAISPAAGGAATSFTLTTTGYTVAGGIGFQWQYTADTTASWTNITGATTAAYTFTGISANTYYRCVVSCSASTLSSNTYAVKASYVANVSCTPSYFDSPANPYAMNRVSVTGYAGSTLNDLFTPNSAGYLDRSAAASIINLQYGASYSGTVYYNNADFYYEGQIWIDFNNDGIFAASEAVTNVFGTYASNSSDAFSITIPYGVTTGYRHMRVRNIDKSFTAANSSAVDPCASSDAAVTYYYGCTNDYIVNIVVPPACSGTPAAGTATATVTTATASTAFTLGLTGTTVAAGLTFQWQSSTASATGGFTSISGATSSVYNVSGITAPTWYRCTVTCTSAAASNTSSVVKVNYTNCLPIYLDNPPTTYSMKKVVVTGYGGYNLNDLFTPSATGYLDRTSVTPLQVQPLGTYSGNVTYNTSYSSYENQIWIDFNDNYTFESSENVTGVFGAGVGVTSETSDAFTMTIPNTATIGTHLMRVRNVVDFATANSTAMDPCAAADAVNSYYYGNTEDYLVTVVAAPACSGTPAGGAASAAPATGCSGYTSALSLSGYTVASGYTFQWQSSTDGGATWSNIAGATNTTYSATITANTLFHVITTCPGSGMSATSSNVSVSVTQPITGPAAVCVSGTITLSDATAGGTWSSVNPGKATVGASTGVVSGVAVGAATIRYTVTGCVQTYALTVTNTPAAIGGTASACVGATAALTESVAGGTWTSNDTTIATVNVTTGVVTGVAAGTTTITNTNTCGSAVVSFTVNPAPAPLVGVPNICISSTTTFSDASSSGTWSISGAAAGTTIDAVAGIVSSATTTGAETVTYTIGSCTATASLYVGNSGPTAITGTATACAGTGTTLGNGTPGGVWSSSNTAVATVNSSTGAVTGISNGTATISYNVGCGSPSYATQSYVVTGTAINITYGAGASGVVCAGSALNLNSGTTSGGTYTWSGPNSFTSTLQNPSIPAASTLASGVYTLIATVGSCTATGYQFVAVDTAGSVTAAVSNPVICTGGSSVLSAGSVSSNYTVNAIPYQLFDTTGTTRAAGDDGAVAVTMPFSFTLYGNTYTTVNIGVNGYVNFGTRLASSDNLPSALPSTSTGTPRALIALFWADLLTTRSSGGLGDIRYTTLGSAPNRKFIISFNNVSDYGTSTNLNNGQIVLYETTNVIELYVTKANPGGTHTPVSGIMNNAGTSAATVPGENAQNYTINSPTGWRFSLPAYTYAWSPATALSSTSGAIDTAAGLTATQTYTVSAVDANNGCATPATATATVAVVAQPAITLSATPASLCSGGSETLVGTPSGGTGTATYTWSGPGIPTTTGTTATPAAFTPTATVTTTGAYSVSLAYTGSGCTTATASSAAVTINPQPTATVSSSVSSICNGGTQVLTAATTGGSGTATYTWRGPGIATTTGSSPTITLTPTVTTTTIGAYSVSVSFSGSGCLPATAVTGTDTVNANPDITVGASPAVCMGVTSANLTYTGAAGAPATYSIVYSAAAHTAGFTDVTSATLPASPIVLTVPAAATPAAYSGTITVSNACTSTASHGFNITVNTVPTASVTSAPAPCAGTAAALTVTGTPGATVTYSYNGGTSATFTLSGAGNYSYVTTPVYTSATFLLSMVNNVSCSSTPGVTTTITPVNQAWTGSTSTDWNTASNWACGSVPVASENVLIPSGTTYAPELMSAETGAVDSLTINSGAVVTLDSPASLNVAGNLVNNSIVTGAGTVTLNGTAAQKLRGNGYVYNMTLNNTAGATINSSSDTVRVKNTLTLTAGTFTTNNSLVLAADFISTGNIAAIPAGAGISGNLTTMSYVFGHRAYRFWAHPFTASIPLSQIEQYIDITGDSGSVHGFTTTVTNAPSAFWYNPLYANSHAASDPGWRPFTSANGTPDSNLVHRFQGFRIFARGAKGTGLDGSTYVPMDAVVGMYGTVNTGDISIPLQKGTDTFKDYNMVGNPYPSPVDIGAAVYAAGANIHGLYYYVWDPYLGTMGTGGFIVKPIDGTSYYLGNNQSFQVRAASNSSVLAFHEANKGTRPSTRLLKTNPDYLSLYIYDADRHLCDMTYLKFNDQATDNEDESLDAQKAVNPSINFYTKSADGNNLTIDQRPYDESKVIPLGLTTTVAQPYIIKVDNANIPVGGQVYLHDKMLETYTLLQKGTEYTFDVTANSATQGDRFELSMKRNEAAVVPATDLNVQMIPNPATDAVNITYTASTKEQTDIRVMTVSGAVVINESLGVQLGGTVSIPVSKLAGGVYMVELTHGASKIVQRLVKD